MLKHLKQSSPKLACVTRSRTVLDLQAFVAIGSGVSAPQIRDFALPLGLLVFLICFWFFGKATAYP